MRSALLSLLVATSAAAQSPCFDDVPVHPWNSQSVGAATGAARQALDIEMCAAGAPATAALDAWHGLYQGAGASDADAVVTIEDIEPGGSAGLVLSRDPRRPDTAGVHLVAERDAQGAVVVHARFRPVAGAPAAAFGSEPYPIELPATLRIRRAGAVVYASVLAGGDEVEVLSIDVSGTDLDFQALAGLVAGGAIDGSARTARFSAPHLETGFEPPPDVACVEPSVVGRNGSTLRFTGTGLDRVTSAHVLGAEARLVEASPRGAILEVGAVDAEQGQPSLVLRHAHAIERTVVAGGQPVIRGDLDLDGKVTFADLKMLDGWLSGDAAGPCAAPADVNGDGVIDNIDKKRLRGFLIYGRPAPAEPFRTPGVIEGSEACDARPGPVVTDLLDASGNRVREPLAEGDTVTLVGANLPVDGTVRFGTTSGRISPESSAERLIVRLGTVPAGGEHCLVLGEGRPQGRVAFGRSFGGDPIERPDLCVPLMASRVGAASVSRLDAEGRLFLPLPSDDFGRDVVNLSLDLPFARVEGGSRGARSVRLRYEAPQGRDGGPVDYETWLAGLAQAASQALEEDNEDCGCDIAVIPQPSQQGMSFAPCAEVPEPPPVDPTPHAPNLDIKKTKPSLGGAAVWAPYPRPSCDDLGEDDLRLWAWCQFADVTRIKEEIEDPWRDIDTYLGLPVFEGFRPLTSILGQLPWVIDPRDQPVALKYVMVEPILHDEMKYKRYYSPCGIAARAHYCDNHASMWMQGLSSGKRIVKNFFVTEGSLPTGRPLSDYYSYVPKDHSVYPPIPQPRQYLVGMHVSVSIPNTGANEAFFKWSTFWVPPPQGATHTRDGRPLSAVYNPNCVTGSGQDSPQELQGTVWGNFHMCVQANADEHCGNPWGPANECTPDPADNLDCQDCHEAIGKVTWNNNGGYEDAIHVGWMSFLGYQANDARACRDYIIEMEDAGTPVYTDPSCELFD